MSEKVYTFINDIPHTLGNLLQGELLNDSDIKFVGYSVPHPLENTMVLKINTTKKTPDKALEDAKKRLNTKFNDISILFKSITN